MKINSSAFASSESIPKSFTCDGGGKFPPLSILDIPSGTKSLALVVDDPDAPMGTFTHYLLWNITPDSSELSGDELPPGAVSGTNSSGKPGYYPPCPPSGRHRYYFKVYALDIILDLPDSTRKGQLEKEMQGHVLGFSELIGVYGR